MHLKKEGLKYGKIYCSRKEEFKIRKELSDANDQYTPWNCVECSTTSEAVSKYKLMGYSRFVCVIYFTLYNP